ncbi:MAG: ACP S-malonyltransferase [Acidimicrobiia bacterium]
MKYAVLFPGQGSQSVGMCPDIRTDRPRVFEEASEILGWDLAALIENGPEDVLTETQHAQPALFVTSFALWSEFSGVVDGGPVAFAGHSLGEYTALTAAEALSFDSGLALVAERGLAMAEAGSTDGSGMAALLGADEETAERIASERRAAGGKLYVANINAPGQIVVAGGTEDLAWLSENARDLGVRRAVILNVAAGFHSPFMQPARDRLSVALNDATFDDPQAAVFANATAAVTHDPRATLDEQLTAPVRFAASLQNMHEAGVEGFVHIGPGDVTAGLAKRSVPDATVYTVSTLVEARTVAEELSVE